jgi:hypothetical protein
MRFSPLASFFKALYYLLTGRLRFPREHSGYEFVDTRGQHFTVFREVIIKPSSDQPTKPGAVFIPHFHVSGMSVRQNIRFSLIPIPFIIGLPGFRSKRWMVDETTGDFSGYYEWDTVEDAERYANSFAMRFMTNRSIPESVWRDVYPAEDAPPPPHF